MSGLSFKPYQPGVSTYATRISDQEWHQYRQLLTDLHQRRLGRQAMLEELAKHGFQPSKPQLNAQMRKWNLTAQSLSTDTTAEHGSTIRGDDLSISDCAVVNLDGMEDQQLACEEQPQDNMHPPCQIHDSLPVLNHQLDSLSATASDCTQTMMERPPITTAIHFEDDTLRVRLRNLAQKLQLFKNDVLDPVTRVPSECCCLDFFYGTGCFERAENFYLSCLEGCKGPMSLHFILMLVNYLNVCEHGHVDHRVQSMIQQALNHYLDLAARADTKNVVVDSIVHQLSDLSHNFMNSGIDFPDVESMPTHFIGWGELISPQMCPTSQTSSDLQTPSLPRSPSDSSEFSGMEESHFQSILERCRKVLTRERYNMEAMLFWVDTSWTNRGDRSVLLEQSTLVKLARYIASYLSNDYSTHPAFYTYDPARVAHHQLIILLEAVGLLVMTRLGSILQQDGGHGSQSFLDRVSYALQSSIAELLPSEADSLFVQKETIRNTILKLRRLFWICGLDDIDPHRSNLHAGQCYFNDLWTSLRTDIHDFDEERTWLEKQIFLNVQRNDCKRGLTGDNESVSVNTSSTNSSFKRFRAYAWKIASQKNKNSASSQHSASMLSDKFGFTLGSDADDTTSQLHPTEEYGEKDQAEFKQMQDDFGYDWSTFVGANLDLELRDDGSESSFGVEIVP